MQFSLESTLILDPCHFRLKIDTRDKHIKDYWMQVPHDDCYIGKYYQWRIHTVAQAVEFHRETHHPTAYNEPNAPLIAHIELDMQGDKPTRFVDNFLRMAPIKYKFEHGQERKILVFTKGQESIDAAINAGATLAGGADLVKQIQNGDLNLGEFDHVLAQTAILPEIVPLRGLMKKKFPNVKNSTLGNDIKEMVTRAMIGIQYGAAKDDYQKNFGLVTTQIGTLEMPVEHLEDNLKNLLIDIDAMRPRREGKFITRVLLKSPPSKEVLKVDPFLYVQESKSDFKRTSKGAVEEDEDESGDGEETNEQPQRAVN